MVPPNPGRAEMDTEAVPVAMLPKPAKLTLREFRPITGVKMKNVDPLTGESTDAPVLGARRMSTGADMDVVLSSVVEVMVTE